jgi:hypothetical protein
MLMHALHPLNWTAGWGMILCGFLAGAAIGVFFHREEFLGGYTSLRRRIVRLGHIACVALGGLNVLFAVAVPVSSFSHAASILLICGAVLMPAICFLTGWKTNFRHAFFIPVLCLVGGVVLVLIGGVS